MASYDTRMTYIRNFKEIGAGVQAILSLSNLAVVMLVLLLEVHY
jgi:hypothetical protein